MDVHMFPMVGGPHDGKETLKIGSKFSFWEIIPDGIINHVYELIEDPCVEPHYCYKSGELIDISKYRQ
jgi:hypothetical protein